MKRALYRLDPAVDITRQLLNVVLVDCIELDNGYHRCRHCRRSSHMGEPVQHGEDCVVGQAHALLAVSDAKSAALRGVARGETPKNDDGAGLIHQTIPTGAETEPRPNRDE